MDPEKWNLTGEVTDEDRARLERARTYRRNLDGSFSLLDAGGREVAKMRWADGVEPPSFAKW